MARKRKPSKEKHYKVSKSKSPAGDIYHITPQEYQVTNAKGEVYTRGSTVHEAYTTNPKPGTYGKKPPGMRRVRQAAYQSGATKRSTSSVNVTVVGQLKESEGIEFEEPIDVAITYTMDREDFMDFVTFNNSSESFANEMGSFDSHVWDGVSEISIEAYE